MPSGPERGSGPSIDFRGVYDAAKSIWRGLFGKHQEDCGDVPCPPGGVNLRPGYEGEQTEDEKRLARAARARSPVPKDPTYSSFIDRGISKPKKVPKSKIKKKGKTPFWKFWAAYQFRNLDPMAQEAIKGVAIQGILDPYGRQGTRLAKGLSYLPGAKMPTPMRMGSRASQRGQLGTVTAPRSTQQRAPRRSNAPPVATRAQRPRSASVTMPAPRRSVLAPNVPLPGMLDPMMGQDPLDPQIYEDYIQVLESKRVGQPQPVTQAEPVAMPGTGDAPAQQVHPGPRPAPATAGAPGSAGSAQKPASQPRNAGARARVALPNLGASVLPVDALLAYALGSLSRRSNNARQTSQFPSAATPGARPGYGYTLAQGLNAGTQPGLAYDLDKCKCKKKKQSAPRKPRTECWKGSYVETSSGTRKTRRERVPC